MAFPVEVIPDTGKLFRRITVHQLNPKTGKPSSAAFGHERSSVDWQEYTKTAAEAAKELTLMVVSIFAGECRTCCQTVEHTPIEPEQPGGPNQAHAEICGNKSDSIKTQLRDLAKIEWTKAAIP